ncbi:calcium-binding protein [Nostoc sphaeroides]|uniref:Calcium-binding protein n=1 Tax=Nostoc sphaeroides CCNUC1 TaxID=2653204 RepID=A0A5P8VX19_9NOSO|nr:hypothetical protein [Nostoc sphaeroides]QFS44965.1 calcium-binding protein [Nostoc sphaeroides CCNUC1]
MAIIDGSSFSDVLFGTDGNDVIFGNPGGSGLFDYDGYDTLFGFAGNDTLFGNNQDDILYGGDGNDILSGSGYSGLVEYDTLVGGAGSDTFVIGNSLLGVRYQGLGYATITDWNPSSDFILAGGFSSLYSFGNADLSGGFALDTQIYYGNDLIANVQDTTNVSVSRDFIFA